MAKEDKKTEEKVEEKLDEGKAPADIVLNRLYIDRDGKKYTWTLKSGASEPTMIRIDE